MLCSLYLQFHSDKMTIKIKLMSPACLDGDAC